jgi:hypothetical protein
MTSDFDNNEFNLYGSVATITAKWELAHDRLSNGVVIHHIPFGTSKASTIINSIRYVAKKAGYQIRATWVDNWSVKIVWYK